MISALHQRGFSWRANALPLLDDGMSCEVVAKVSRIWTTTRSGPGTDCIGEDGIEGLASFRLRRKCLPTDGGAAGEADGR